MSKPSHAKEAQAVKKVQPKPQSAPEQTGGELALAELGYGPLGVADTPNIQGQARRLGDPRLHMIQRHMLANQIGRVQGNGHLQQVIAAVRGDVKTTQRQLSASQADKDRVGSGVQPAGIVIHSVQRWPFDDDTRTERQKIDDAIRSRDPSDVKAIQDVNQATESEKLQLINILAYQGWVGPRDEYKLEEIWGSFGDQLARVMEGNDALWNHCVDVGAELEDLQPVRRLRQQFKQDVIDVVTGYLFSNRAYVMQEMESLGIPADENASPSALTDTQTQQMQELQEAATIVSQLQQGREDLRRVKVGYDIRPPMAEGDHGGFLPSYFNPLEQPALPPHQSDSDAKPWAEVKAAYDQATAIITVLTDQHPALYAISREGQSAITGQFADAVSPAQARTQLGTALRKLFGDIEGTQQKVNQGELDPLDLLPIHLQLFVGKPVPSGIQWGSPLPKWAANYEKKDHEASEFWTRLGLDSLAAAAFLLAPFTGGASMLVMLVGLAATGAQAYLSTERYEALSQAARTSVRSGTELVTPEQVSMAEIQMQADQIALIIAAITVAVSAVASTGAALRALRGRAVTLRTLIGETKYAEYQQAIEALKAEHPALAHIPSEDLIAIRGYTDNDWARLNLALRTQNPEELAQLQEYIKGATSGLRQLPSYQGQVSRTVSFSEAMAAEYRQGAIVTERGFTSTTIGQSVAQREGNTLMIIQSRTGKDISLIARFPQEREVLFLPGTRFQVTSVQPLGQGYIIHMAEVGM